MSVKTCESLACVAGAGLLHARGTRKGERRQLSLIYSPPFSLSRSLVLEISLFAPKTTGACYAGLANLNPLKCNNSASGKISLLGSYRSWKTWTVVEFYEFHFQGLENHGI